MKEETREIMVKYGEAQEASYQIEMLDGDPIPMRLGGYRDLYQARDALERLQALYLDPNAPWSTSHSIRDRVNREGVLIGFSVRGIRSQMLLADYSIIEASD